LASVTVGIPWALCLVIASIGVTALSHAQLMSFNQEFIPNEYFYV